MSLMNLLQHPSVFECGLRINYSFYARNDTVFAKYGIYEAALSRG
jgi:hypothetical protein